jgi:hypothetical protein
MSHQHYSPVLQRVEVEIVREAISQFLASGDSEGAYEIDGCTVLVSREPEFDNLFSIGLYRLGSEPEGECDGYYVCSADGETNQ